MVNVRTYHTGLLSCALVPSAAIVAIGQRQPQHQRTR